MMRTLLAGILFLLGGTGALASPVSKTGEALEPRPGEVTTVSHNTTDFAWSTGGALDVPPTTGGSANGWGEYFIAAVTNNTGYDLKLVEFGFPCDGPATGDYGWVVWFGEAAPPIGESTTCDYHGSFTPASNTGAFPPTVYTYVSVVAENIVWPHGETLVFGYDNTALGGQIMNNGVHTWAWYGGYWDPDAGWGRTALLQVKANYTSVPVQQATWASLKELYR